MDRETEEIFYGIGYVKGYVVNDDISITNSRSTAAKAVNFLSVNEAHNLAMLESDGLLGLSPELRSRGASGEEVHLLINELKIDGVID